MLITGYNMKYKVNDEVLYQGKKTKVINVDPYSGTNQIEYLIKLGNGKFKWVNLDDLTPINSKEIPQHYQKNTINGLDVIDLIKIFNLNFNEGNILKYLLRKKGQDLQDLEKIINYAQREADYIKKKQEENSKK